MKTQTRLILCAAIFALALLALASVPLGTQGKSTQFLRAGAGNTNEGISHPFVSGSVLAEDPDNSIDMKGITTGPRAAPTPPADPDRPIPMDHIDKAVQLDEYCRDKRRLYDTLKDLRARKENDATPPKGTCIHQVGLKEKIRIVIEALMNCEGYIGPREEEIKRRSEPIDSSENCPPPTTTPSGAVPVPPVPVPPVPVPPVPVPPVPVPPDPVPPVPVPPVPVPPDPVPPDPGTKSGGTETGGTNSGGGLKTVKFENEQSRVTVSLPDDMMPGDTISGTVMVEPKGKKSDGRSMPLELLFDSFKTVNVPTSGRSRETFTMKIPASVANDKGAAQIKVALKGKGGKDLGFPNMHIVMGQPGRPIESSGAGQPAGTANDIGFPNMHIVMGQQGRPIEIPGPFDGSVQNTKVQVGGQEVPVLAESPRKAVFESPTNITGPTEVVLNEGGKETKGQYRNLGVNLTAPKTSLLRGESTELRVEVNGLQGITEPVPLHLVKGGVVTMQGGDVQTMSIKPAEVQSNGTFTTTRKITGVQAGVWSATATVVVFDVCLQDDNNGNQLSFSSTTGDYIFCQFDPKSGTSNALVRTDGVMDFSGGVYVAVGDVSSITKNGTFTSADFNYKSGQIHAQIDSYRHTGNATVQTSSPKRTFTITDRDTRNNTCTCR